MNNEEPMCWFCGKRAICVWHTTWDEPGQRWPMCGECSSHVGAALVLRAEGQSREADALDEQYGIATDGWAGHWIPPVQPGSNGRSEDSNTV